MADSKKQSKEGKFTKTKSSSKSQTHKQADRFLKVSGLSLKVTGSYLKQRIKEVFQEADEYIPERIETHLRNARRIAETIGEMKGTIMKLGQMLSLNREFLPPEFADVLSGLQQDAPPIEFSLIKEQVENELGLPLAELFADFNEKPLGAASIGQVHYAKLKDGREVAVKVQYPGVEEDVESDIKNIKILFHSLKALGTEFNFTHLTKELRERMMEELDYENEANNLEDFREHFKDLPRVKIPRPIREFTKRRVLTMEYLPGVPLAEFSKNETSGTKRNRVGEVLVRFYLKQLFQHGVLHADPNPGNFSVGENENLIVYDLGCVKPFPKSFIQNYKRLIRDYFAGNYEEIEPGLERLGIKKIKDRPYPLFFYMDWADLFMSPYNEEPYNFGEGTLQDEVMKKSRENLSDIMNFKPPKHILFHNRVLVGAYQNLRTLGAVGYWRSILKKCL